MAAIQIPDKIDHQFEAFAHSTGESKEELVRQALLSYLEDRQDAAIAAERLKNIGERTSLANIGKEFDLED
jgi:predicted DNA-binding protein